MNISEKLFNFRQSDNVTFYDTLTNLISNFTLVNEYLNIKEKEFSIINKDDTVIVILKKELENNSFIDNSNILDIINNDNEGYIYIYKLKKELNNIIDELEKIENMRYNDVLDEEKLKSLILKKEKYFKDDCSSNLLDNLKVYLTKCNSSGNISIDKNNNLLEKYIGKECLNYLIKLDNIKVNDNSTIGKKIQDSKNNLTIKNIEKMYKNIINNINNEDKKIINFYYFKILCLIYKNDSQSICALNQEEISNNIIDFNNLKKLFDENKLKNKDNYIELFDIINKFPNLSIPILLFIDTIHDFTATRIKSEKNITSENIIYIYNIINDLVVKKDIKKNIKKNIKKEDDRSIQIDDESDDEKDIKKEDDRSIQIDDESDDEKENNEIKEEVEKENNEIYLNYIINNIDILNNVNSIKKIISKLNIKIDVNKNNKNEIINQIKTILSNINLDDIILIKEKEAYKKENKEFIEKKYKERFFIKKNNKYIFSDECKSTILCTVFYFFNENQNDNLIKNLPTLLYNIIKSLDENKIFYLYIFYFFIKNSCQLNKIDINILNKYYDINTDIDNRIYTILWKTIPYIDKWSVDFSNKNILDFSKKTVLPSSLVDANKSTSSTFFKDYTTTQTKFTLWAGTNFNYIYNKNNCNLTVKTDKSNNSCDYNSIDYELNSYCDINLGYNNKDSSTNFFIKEKNTEIIPLNIYNKIDISTIEKIIYSNKTRGPSVNEIFSIIKCFKNGNNTDLPLSFIDSLFSLKRIGDLGQIIESKLNKIPLYTDDKMEALIGIAFGCSIITSCGNFLIWYDGETDSLKSLLTYDNQFIHKKNCKSFDIKRNNSKEYFDQLKKIEYFGDIFNVEIKDNKICKKDYCSI
jgi:hypothetical protein